MIWCFWPMWIWMIPVEVRVRIRVRDNHNFSPQDWLWCHICPYYAVRIDIYLSQWLAWLTWYGVISQLLHFFNTIVLLIILYWFWSPAETAGIVVVLHWYTECQTSHCSMTRYLTIVGESLFLMVRFQPPLSGILINLRLWVPSGIFDDKHACNYSGDRIIHACIKLLYETTLT